MLSIPSTDDASPPRHGCGPDRACKGVQKGQKNGAGFMLCIEFCAQSAFRDVLFSFFHDSIKPLEEMHQKPKIHKKAQIRG